MSFHTSVTPDMLNDIIESDSPFHVYPDGVVFTGVNVPYIHAPEVYDEEIISDDWEFTSTGYTGQYGYNGPIMHASELLSGRLARDILETPGIYVVVASIDIDDNEPIGWVVLRYTKED